MGTRSGGWRCRSGFAFAVVLVAASLAVAAASEAPATYYWDHDVDAETTTPLLPGVSIVTQSSRQLLQYDPGFPWPVQVMPYNNSCNRSAEQATKLWSDYQPPVNSTWCFTVWNQPGKTGAYLGQITAPLNGQTSADASFTNVIAMGFEIGKNCTNAVAGATFTLYNGTKYIVPTANIVYNMSMATGKVNITLGTPVSYDVANNSKLCIQLRSPCTTMIGMCQYGNLTCGSFITVLAYRQKQSCVPNCAAGTTYAGMCTARNTPLVPPTDCVGNWSNWTAYNSTHKKAIYHITLQPQYAGEDCEATDGAVKYQNCSGSCPVDCVGSWGAWGACSQTCGSGTQMRTYAYTTVAANGGTACPYANGATQNQACNTHACPSPPPPTAAAPSPPPPTAAALSPPPPPPAADSPPPPPAAVDSPPPPPAADSPPPPPSPAAADSLPPPPAAVDSPPPPAADSPPPPPPPAAADSPPPPPAAVDSPPPPPAADSPPPPAAARQSCIGFWSDWSDCFAQGCGENGTQTATFIVTRVASGGGAACEANDGVIKSQLCYMDPCPYVDPYPPVIYASSVLPPLPPMNETGIIIRGGNVSITGVKVEGLGFGNTSNSNLNGFNASTSNSLADSLSLKPRWAAFNGSLGFITFGVVVEVLGEFTIQRTMNWTLNTTLSAWTTQVAVGGKFLLNRDDVVNSVVVSSRVLEPKVWGILTLYSSIYPGPGFSGTYDWAGFLEMSPDPFQEWSDAFSLINNSTQSSSNSSKRRALQQSITGTAKSTTGEAPVQGRISVREKNSGSPNTLVADGAMAIDDTADILVMQPCMGLACVANDTAPSSKQLLPTMTALNAQALPGINGKLLLLIVVLAAATGIALCWLGIVGAVVYRRRKRNKRGEKEWLKYMQQLEQKQLMLGQQAVATAVEETEEQADGFAAVIAQSAGAAADAKIGTRRGKVHRRQGRKPGTDEDDSIKTQSGAPNKQEADGRQQQMPSEPELEHSEHINSNDGSGDLDKQMWPYGSSKVHLVEPGMTGFGTMPGSTARQQSATNDSTESNLFNFGPSTPSMCSNRPSFAGMAADFAVAMGLRRSQAGVYAAPAGPADLWGPTLPGASNGHLDCPKITSAAAAQHTIFGNPIEVAAAAPGSAASLTTKGGKRRNKKQQQPTDTSVQQWVPAMWSLPAAQLQMVAPVAAATPRRSLWTVVGGLPSSSASGAFAAEMSVSSGDNAIAAIGSTFMLPSRARKT